MIGLAIAAARHDHNRPFINPGIFTNRPIDQSTNRPIDQSTDSYGRFRASGRANAFWMLCALLASTRRQSSRAFASSPVFS